jgi:hypothetical protein
MLMMLFSLRISLTGNLLSALPRLLRRKLLRHLATFHLKFVRQFWLTSTTLVDQPS